MMIDIFHNCNCTSELSYSLKVTLNEFLGIDFSLKRKDDLSPATLQICQSNTEAVAEIILPNTLLSQSWEALLRTEILPILPLRRRALDDLPNGEFIENNIPVIYGNREILAWKSSDRISNFDIDIFGSIFFSLSRLEELIGEEKDKHDRFPYHASLFYKEKIHDRAIVNEYVEILWYLLKSKFPELERKKRNYQVDLSHDVDHPISLNFGLNRWTRDMAADVFKRSSPELALKRFVGKLTPGIRRHDFDPNNNFDFIMSESERLGLKSRFNFIVINGKGGIDGHYDLENPFIKKLLTEIKERGHIIGFHPSYDSFDNAQMLQKQYARLRNVCADLNIQQVKWGGRHHYLRWKNPLTWQLWNDLEIDYDSTIGYGDILGFRAGVCFPYSTYNLNTRKHLRLVEHPLVYMDINARQDKSASEVELAEKYAKVVKHFKGHFTVLYHNNCIVSKNEKRNYRKLLEVISG